MSQHVIMFRTKANHMVGFGHLRRCISLAKEFRKQGAKIFFVVNNDPNAIHLLQNHCFERISVEDNDEKNLEKTLVYVKEWNVATLIIDTYDINSQCLPAVRNFAVVVIDPMVGMASHVDLVICGAIATDQSKHLKEDSPRFLEGADYILLSDLFSEKLHRVFSKQINRILITVGGSDSFLLTPKLIAWTRAAFSSVIIEVVVGPFFSEDVKKQINNLVVADKAIILHNNPQTLYGLMLKCDLAITGGGQTTFELAATGTPAIAITLVDNQRCNLSYLSEKATLKWVGDLEDNNLRNKVTQGLLSLAKNLDKRQEMSKIGCDLIDGYGVQRVVKEIMAMRKNNLKEINPVA